MDAIQVNAILLRGLLPDLRLTPGTTLMARVLETHGRHGMLNLAGAIVVAELPEGLEAGQRLRLAVQDASGERVIMRAIPDAQAAPAQQLPGQGASAPTVGLPLPGGLDARVALVPEDDPAAGPGGPRAVTVHYDSPALGRIEVRLAVGAGGLVAGVGAGAGTPLELAGAHAGELREALARAMRTPVDVHVGVRRERVDIRA